MVKVRVPASTSNLGAGFDCFGMALKIYLTVEMDIGPEGPNITALGEGGADIPKNADNLIYRAARRIFEQTSQPLSNFTIKIENSIPLFRGLGSSGAAVIAGLICGKILLESPVSNEDILRLANQIEGHPENAAASLLGGLTINCVDENRVIAQKIVVDENLLAVILIPDEIVSTHEARRVLPKTVAHADAVFNLQRSALLSHALITRDYDALKLAMQDRLHQPFRKHLIKHFDEFVMNGYANGALGVCISGSGSSVLALVNREGVPKLMSAWNDLRRELHLSGRVLTCGFENNGAVILE